MEAKIAKNNGQRIYKMRRTFKGNKKIYLFISALASMVLFLAIWRIPIVQTQHLKPATGKTLFDLENAARIT